MITPFDTHTPCTRTIRTTSTYRQLLLCLQIYKLAQSRSVAAMSKLVNSKAPRGGDSLTPLHLASSASQLDCMRLLLLFGADVGKPSSNGCTPLHEAASRGHCDGPCPLRVSMMHACMSTRHY